MGELLGKRVLRLDAAAAEYGLKLNTIRRWRRSGLLDPSGQRVKLPATKVGAAWWISPDDLRGFIAMLNGRQTESLAVA